MTPRQGLMYQTLGMRPGWRPNGFVPQARPAFQPMPHDVIYQLRFIGAFQNTKIGLRKYLSQAPAGGSFSAEPSFLWVSFGLSALEL
ncbi:hypothetical protein FRX31_032734 [Thalictrum thalictroides]|uniref:Uncharacterized protein n=1 Tax=Thalictrum thalictroides TaxID=46969 RepID=A0A7J6UYF3_THATH|nr:hypothetical protein FRX31_032734 [Thalictrum thalictroides]